MIAAIFSRMAIAGIGLAGIGAMAAASPPRSAEQEAADLVARSAEANAALMRGDIARYRTLVSLTGDFTLMSPFGGAPTLGKDVTDETIAAMGRFFRDGTLEQEVVETYASPDMIVLALIERAHVGVGGLPLQDWALRVTLVYRREAGEWRLAHRHADPLVDGISLPLAAEIARGDRK